MAQASMSVGSLREVAKQKGVKGYSKMNKADLIDALNSVGGKKPQPVKAGADKEYKGEH